MFSVAKELRRGSLHNIIKIFLTINTLFQQNTRGGGEGEIGLLITVSKGQMGILNFLPHLAIMSLPIPTVVISEKTKWGVRAFTTSQQ